VEFAQRIAVSFFLTKSRAWEYEQEWRMIVPIAEADDPYSALHLYSFPPELVKGIILGCRMPQRQRRRFSELVEHDERYRHVSLHEAVVDRDSFAVNVVPVES
jgi:hypothetical protein